MTNIDCPVSDRDLIAFGRIFRSILFVNDTTVKRIIELAEADRDGKCIIRPLKADDTMWVVTKKQEIIECKVRNIRLRTDNVTLLFTCIGRHDDGKGFRYSGNFTPRSIGKTVFTTREEAEAALKGGNYHE